MSSPSVEAGASHPLLYIFGVPGPIGGAATKIAHLIRLLHRDFLITVVLPSAGFLKEKDFKKQVEPFGIRGLLLKDLPKRLEGRAGHMRKGFFQFRRGPRSEGTGTETGLVERNDVSVQRRG